MRHVLQKITENAAVEARWLQTLSLLEFLGARKISKTAAAHHPTLEVLEHYADEVRHALAFKRLSSQVGGGEVDYLGQFPALTYFQSLDRMVSDWVAHVTGEEDSYQNYLMVTAVVERRAMKLYPLYMKTTRQEVVREELERIIHEEANHRQSIEDQALALLKTHGYDDFDACLKMEEDLFAAFTSTLDQEIGKAAA